MPALPISFLAPLHDYSNLPFRLLCQKYGAEATCVPLVNAIAIVQNHGDKKTKTKKLIDAHPDERNLSVQFVGNDPIATGEATRITAQNFPFVKWFNLNCGCPSSRTNQYGGGHVLLKQPKLIAEIIKKMRLNADNRLVSAKIRIRNNLQDTLELCRLLEVTEVDFIIIHGRTPKQGYSGSADWELIRAIKEKLSIPIIGNGNINTAGEGYSFVERGYCDGFMIGRAAMANPHVFSDSGIRPSAGELLHEYIFLHEKYLGPPQLRDLKLKAVNFVNSVKGAAKIRNQICCATSIKEVLAATEKIE